MVCLSPVLHHSTDFIFISFEIIEPILVSLKIEYRLSQYKGAYAASQTTSMYMKGHNKTESPLLIRLCVLCFQMQPFRFFGVAV